MSTVLEHIDAVVNQSELCRMGNLFRLANGFVLAFGEAFCILSRGAVDVRSRLFTTAKSRYAEAIAIFQPASNPRGVALGMSSLGGLSAKMGRHQQAVVQYETAQAGFRRIGAGLGEANCVLGKGYARLRLDRFQQARDAFASAREICRSISNRRGEAGCLRGIGEADIGLGATHEARSNWRLRWRSIARSATATERLCVSPDSPKPAQRPWPGPMPDANGLFPRRPAVIPAD